MLHFLKSIFRSHQLDKDLDDELAAHIAHKQLDLEREGLSPNEAKRQAHLALGNLATTKESTRQAWVHPVLESLLQDFRFGLRLLRKDVAFTSLVLITLTVGIGANSAIFQLLSSLLWQPLPVPHANQLVRLRALAGSNELLQLPYPLYLQLAARTDLFEDTAGILGQGKFALTINNTPLRLYTSIVTPSYFPVLGVQPSRGSFFNEQSANGVVISYKLWQRLVHLMPEVIGAQIIFERLPFTILGVAPQGFEGVHPGVEVEVWLPVSAFEQIFPKLSFRSNNTMWIIQPFARLRTGLSLHQVQPILRQVSPALLDLIKDPRQRKVDSIEAVSARTGFSHFVNSFGPVLWLLFGSATAIVALAILNLTNLLLARATARQTEFSIRLALGAGVSRIRRQLVLETLLLAGAGTALGLLASRWAAQAFLLLVSTGDKPVPLHLDSNWRVLSFVAALLTTVMLIAGWIPARSATTQGSGRHTVSRDQTRLRSTLLVVQFALTFSLLGAAALMALSLRSLMQEQTGLRTDNTLIFSPDLHNAGISDERHPLLYAAVLDELRHSPNIVSAAWTRHLTLAGAVQVTPIELPSHPNLKDDESATNIHQVSDGYFKTMGIPLLLGTDFRVHGVPGQPTAIVSDNFARRYFKTPAAALNQRVRLANQQWLTIIGVVGNAKNFSIRQQAPLTLYTSYWDEQTARGLNLIVHHQGAAVAVTALVTNLINRQTGATPYLKIDNPQQLIQNQLATDRAISTLLTGFALFAVMISAAGIGGLLAYTVQLRRKEIGIRLALGATPQSIEQQFLWQALRLALAGLLGGAILSYFSQPLLARFLFATHPDDPRIWLLVTTILLASACLAAAIPVRRAASISPQETLRCN